MATLAKLKAEARRLGAKVEIEDDAGARTVRVEAPHGKIWREGDVHEIVDFTYRPWKPDYAHIIKRMSYGLEDCPNGPGCDWCHPEDEEDGPARCDRQAA